jgi:hypothetical protein
VKLWITSLNSHFRLLGSRHKMLRARKSGAKNSAVFEKFDG